MNPELKSLLNHVRNADHSSPERVQTAIDSFFQPITWSILKDEWTKMTKVEKRAFCIKVYKEVK
jgi:hypothetical protein